MAKAESHLAFLNSSSYIMVQFDLTWPIPTNQFITKKPPNI